ncbi:MAG: hypothetical protein AAGC60_03035 [Acidobacteriota bacterium]
MSISKRLVLVSLGCAALLFSAVAANAAEPQTMHERLAIIAPLIEHAVAQDAEKVKIAAGPIAAKTGISTERLELWTKLFLNHGRSGLQALDKASAEQMAQEVVGTWEMYHRMVEGRPQQVESSQFHTMREIRPGFASVDSLTLEDGYLIPSLCERQTDCPFRLGTYGVTTFADVKGAEYGLARGETAVLMHYEGEFAGEGYPGFENGARGMIEALWVKQGTTYRTAWFQHEFAGLSSTNEGLPDIGTKEIPPYRNDAIIESTTFEQTVLYEQQVAIEQVRQMDSTSPIWDIPEYWAMAKQDHRLLSPVVAAQATSPGAARNAADTVAPH